MEVFPDTSFILERSESWGERGPQTPDSALLEGRRVALSSLINSRASRFLESLLFL